MSAFDLVKLEIDGSEKDLTAVEFKALPLTERIRMLLRYNATFWLAGQEVSRAEALDSM